MSTARVRLTTLWMGQYETVSNDINKSIKSITRKFILHVLTSLSHTRSKKPNFTE